nr:unnamed protein product [Spirometra erinaceieuropaei]
MRIGQAIFESASYSHHNYNCWAEDQFRAWHRLHVICPKQVFCRTIIDSHDIVQNLPEDVNWLKFSFGDILWIISRNAIPEVLTAVNLSRLYGRIIQIAQQVDEIQIQTLLPKMVASISRLSQLFHDSTLSSPKSACRQANITVAICACLRDVLPTNLELDLPEFIGGLPSSKYLKSQSNQCSQISKEKCGANQSSKGCFRRLLTLPSLWKGKFFEPEGHVAGPRVVRLIPAPFSDWRIASKVYVFGTACPMRMRRTLVEPEEVEDSMFHSTCGGWPLALRQAEHSLEQPDPSAGGDLLQPEEEETAIVDKKRGTEIETPEAKVNASIIRRTQMALLHRLQLRLNRNTRPTHIKYRLETTERLISCVRQAIKCGRIPIMVSGTYLLSEWRSSAELACLSVLLAPEAPKKGDEIKLYRRQMNMWRETIFYAGHLIDLNLPHSPSCPERTAQQIMDFFELINSGRRVVPWMPHTWVAPETDLGGTGFKTPKSH